MGAGISFACQHLGFLTSIIPGGRLKVSKDSGPYDSTHVFTLLAFQKKNVGKTSKIYCPHSGPQ